MAESASSTNSWALLAERETDMADKSKIENAIDFIAKQGAARSHDIGEAAKITANQVSSNLYPYVRGGVLVSCRVDQPGKASCNEYRLATGVTAQNWREFKVGIFSESTVPKVPPKRITAPAHTPADQPQVSVTNSGSTPVGNTLPPATGRAVTHEKPHRKMVQPVSGAGGHVTTDSLRNIPENIPGSVISKFGYFSDGSVRIVNGERAIELDQADAKRLADFLMNCMISNEVNR